jgi:hypothetical protein
MQWKQPKRLSQEISSWLGCWLTYYSSRLAITGFTDAMNTVESIQTPSFSEVNMILIVSIHLHHTAKRPCPVLEKHRWFRNLETRHLSLGHVALLAVVHTAPSPFFLSYSPPRTYKHRGVASRQ